MNNAPSYRPHAAPYYTPSASQPYGSVVSGPSMSAPSMAYPSRTAPRYTAPHSGLAPAGFVPARSATYPPLAPVQTYRAQVSPGTPVTASQALQSTLEEARSASKRKDQNSTRLKSLVAFFVFWVVVSSLFLLLYVDRMI